MAKLSRKIRAKAKAAKTTTKQKAAAVPAAKGKAKREERHQLSSVWQLSRKAIDLLWHNKKLFIGITLIYGLLNLILALGLASTPAVAKLKGQLSSVFSGHTSSISASLKTFVTLGSTGNNNSNSAAGVYQFFLILIVSLATIWAIRQVMSGKAIRVRDAFYSGMYPLVQFLLTIVLVGLQLLPLFVGSSLYIIVISNDIAASQLEKLVWVIIFAVLTCFSFYMLCASVFALYIVTLPGLAPVRAMRMAGKLVKRRRSVIIPKLLFLPCALLIIAAIIIVPVILWVTPLAKLVYFLMTIFAIPIIHSYLFNLYRELSSDNE